MEVEPDVIVRRANFLFHHDFSSDDSDAVVNDKLEHHYTIGKQIGIGRGVRICRHKRTGHERALKILEKSTISAESFRRETSALRKVDHPNLLRLYESFEDDDSYYIVTELSTAGNLYDFLVNNCATLTEAHMARLMKQILICVNHCHALNIIHCDIKPENILMEKDDTNFEHLILADFGFSQFYEAEARMNRIMGTPLYFAPEVFQRNYSTKCDIWSCGVLAFVLLTGQFPFTGKSTNPMENAKEIYRQINRRRDHFDLDVWNSRSHEGKSFVQQLLTIDEMERPTAQAALRHPWFRLMLEPETSQNLPQTPPALDNLLEFSARQKLKQATYCYLVAHRTFKSRKRVVDKIFRRLDANSDGVLSQCEIADAFRAKGQLLSPEELKAILAKVDIDQNGCINYWEFLAATTSPDILLCSENLKLAFEAFDKNSSGSISAEEVRSLFCNQQLPDADGEGAIDDSVIDAIIRQVDEDGDGEISYGEFAKLMQENILPHKRPSDQSELERDDNTSQRRRQ